MFKTGNNHLLHKKATQLVIDNLPGATDMDAVVGYYAPYDVEWKGIKFLVKLAKPSKKKTQNRAKWFYTLKEKDHKIVDYFILFAILGNKAEAIYVIPKVFVPSVYITITKLDGNMRYDYFKTDIGNLAKKVLDTKKRLPKLIKIHDNAKTLRGGL